jgi:ABC-type uncharacterized transport system fused permease/ATPase subunit
MGETMENIHDNIYDRIEKLTLESFGLFLVLITVVLSLITTTLVIFEQYGTARLIATFTLINMAGAFVSLGVYNVTKEDD